MKDACAVAFVVDGRDGLLPLDEYLAAHIRRMGLPTLCVVNKVDGLEKEDELLAEFHSLGFPLLPVSAEHGHNIRALTEELADLLPDDYEAEHEPPALRLAMLGRPNAGKSSMINALAGEERMIVSDVAGTTRDSVDVRFERDGQDYVFVDTAGVRRRTKITDIVEKYSVNAALKSTTKADVTLLTLDATEGVSQQDKRLMDLLDTRKIPFMVLVNKCDLVPGLRPLDRKDTVLISAREKTGFEELLSAIMAALEPSQKRLKLLLPYTAAGLLAEIRQEGKVFSEEYTPDGILADALVHIRVLHKVAPYQIS